MKYSIRGIIKPDKNIPVVNALNTTQLWRLVTKTFTDKQGVERFLFEVWVDLETEKNHIFDLLKSYITEIGERIDWHECYHDESYNKPCEVSEVYEMTVD